MATNTYAILTDATSDLPKSYIEEHNLIMFGLTYTIEGKNYNELDAGSLSPEIFYSKLKSGEISKTSQITPDVYEKQFKALLDKGLDIIYIGFSSGLSGSLQSANIAKKEISDRYPDRKILIVDSLCASLGQGLLVDYAVKLKEAGGSLIDVFMKTKAQALHICHYFTVDDLNHLYRGGRVSKISAMVGTLLGIKPVLHVDNEGKLVAYGKVRGRKASLDALVEKVSEKGENCQNDYVFISHGDCLADAQYIAEQVEKRFGLKSQIINFVGPVIGTHSGPGTVALFFMGVNRNERGI